MKCKNRFSIWHMKEFFVQENIFVLLCSAAFGICFLFVMKQIVDNFKGRCRFLIKDKFFFLLWQYRHCSIMHEIEYRLNSEHHSQQLPAWPMIPPAHNPHQTIDNLSRTITRLNMVILLIDHWKLLSSNPHYRKELEYL